MVCVDFHVTDCDYDYVVSCSRLWNATRFLLRAACAMAAPMFVRGAQLTEAAPLPPYPDLWAPTRPDMIPRHASVLASCLALASHRTITSPALDLASYPRLTSS